MRRYGGLAVLLSLLCAALCRADAPRARVAQDAVGSQAKAAVRALRGIPLGGIGCGTVEILPTGRFARATINNNWERPIESMPGCFAAVWSKAGDKTSAHVFSMSPAFGLPGSANLEFDGYFPRAVLKEADPRSPVSITLRAFSSLVPQDLKNSSIPAALLVFTVKNEANAPIEASVAVSWENLLGVGGTAGKGAFSDRSGNTLEMLPATNGIFGVKMSSPDRQLVDPPHRLLYNTRGTYALLAAPTSPDTVVTSGGWNAVSGTPNWWNSFAENGTVGGSVGTGVEGKIHPAAVLALKVPLKENETCELPFVVAWHTPRLYTLSGTEYGHFYEKSFDEAVETGRYALENRQSLAALLDEWQNRLLRSSLPGWLIRRAMNDASIVFTNSLLTRTSGTGGTDPGPYRFALVDIAGNGAAALGAIQPRYLAQSVLMTWFPDLDYRELEEIMTRREASGRLRPSLGTLDTGFATDEPDAPPTDPAHLASYAFQIAARFRRTGDQKFLDRFYPSVKYAVEVSASLPTVSEETTDTTTGAAVRMRDRLYWLASCAIGKSLADAMRDRSFSAKCREWIEQAERRPADHISEEELLTSAVPPIWMAEALNVSTRTLSRLSSRLTSLVCAAQSVEMPPVGPVAAIPVGLFGIGSMARRTESESGVLAAAMAAATRPDCAMAWLAGIDAQNRTNAVKDHLLEDASGWTVLNALLGIALDLPRGRLTIAPSLPPRAKSLTAPVFAPTFWASLDYRLNLTNSRITFRLDRLMPAQPVPKESPPTTSPNGASSTGLVLHEVLLPSRKDRVILEVTSSVGRAPVPGTFSRQEDGRLLFTFATPLSLIVGQSLTFQMR